MLMPATRIFELNQSVLANSR